MSAISVLRSSPKNNALLFSESPPTLTATLLCSREGYRSVLCYGKVLCGDVSVFGHTDEVYDKLQAEADLAMLDAQIASDFNRPILNRLKDFVTVAISSMKLYPSAMMLQLVVPDRIEIKVSGLSTAVVVFASVEQLCAEVYLNKMADSKHLPFPRVLKQDLSFTALPVAYAVYSFVAGVALESVLDEPMQRVAARQVGRVIRSLHLLPAHGLGAPQPSGKWSTRTWGSLIQQWLSDRGDAVRLEELLGKQLLGSLVRQTITHPLLQHFAPVVLFGDIHSRSILVLVHGNIQLEGLTRSGVIVAGDPMFDVAASMRTSLGTAFRQGFFEGYTMHAPITSDEIARVKRYSLLWRVVDSMAQLTTPHAKTTFVHSVKHVVSELESAAS